MAREVGCAKKEVMKATLTLMAGLMVLWSVNTRSAATVSLNNYDSGNPVAFCGYDSWPVGLAPAQGTYVELFHRGAPVVDITTQSSIIPLTEDGFFFGSVGIVPGVADNATTEFELRFWTGSDPWDLATQRGQATWTQVTGSWNPNSVPPTPPTGAALQNPVLCFYIPESSTIALGLMGGAAMLLLRRKR